MPADDVKCDPFPDLYRSVPADATDAERKAIQDEDDLHQKLYTAVAYILVNDFRFNEAIPPQASGFPGTLGDAEQAFFLGVYGLLLADNWKQPSLGRTSPGQDDLQLPGGDVVTRRFVDATVGAVQEYTSNAALFTSVFGFLKGSGAPSSGTQPVSA